MCRLREQLLVIEKHLREDFRSELKEAEGTDNELQHH